MIVMVVWGLVMVILEVYTDFHTAKFAALSELPEMTTEMMMVKLCVKHQ
jgi:hypothetical protein